MPHVCARCVRAWISIYSVRVTHIHTHLSELVRLFIHRGANKKHIASRACARGVRERAHQSDDGWSFLIIPLGENMLGIFFCAPRVKRREVRKCCVLSCPAVAVS